MTDLRTAAQQALEAMEREAEYYLQEHSEYNEILLTAITALKAALAEPVQKPLTEELIRALYDQHAAYQEEGPEVSGWLAFTRAIERAHGIGGNT